MIKVYYNKIMRAGSNYTVADISNVSAQRDVVAYAKAQVIAGKLSEKDYDEKFKPYEVI